MLRRLPITLHLVLISRQIIHVVFWSFLVFGHVLDRFLLGKEYYRGSTPCKRQDAMLEDAGFEQTQVSGRVGQSDAIVQVSVVSKHQVSTDVISKIRHAHKSIHVVTRIVVREHLEIMEDCHAEKASVLAHEHESMVPVLHLPDDVLVSSVGGWITRVE
jgi:hypothetical protein